MATRAGALDIARSSGILSSKSVARDRWTTIIPTVSGLQKEVSGRLSSFKPKKLLDEGLNSFDVKNQLAAHKPIWESLRNFSEHLFRHQKGTSLVHSLNGKPFILLKSCCLFNVRVSSSNLYLYTLAIISLVIWH